MVGSGGALWLGRAEGGRGVDGGRGSASDAGRSEAGQEGGDVTGVGNSEGAGGAVVVKGEAEEFCGEGVGFAVI